MYALVEIAGVQFEVEPGDIIEVPLLDAEPNESVTFDKILLVGNDERTVIGEPYITGIITADVLEHFKGDKVLVFKKKRRKGYRKLNGHRQWFSLIGLTKFEVEGFDTEEADITLVTSEYDEEIYDDDIVTDNEEVEIDDASSVFDDDISEEKIEEEEESFDEEKDDDESEEKKKKD